MKPRIALLQRAIAHYRFPLFRRLQEQSRCDWVFHSASHEQGISTGLPSDQLHRLTHRPIRNRHVFGPVWYQSGVSLRGFDGLMLDLGWTLLSNPRYLLEARARGVAIIGWSKGIPQNPNRPESPAKRAYQKFILSLCDVIVLYGSISRDYFLKLGFPADRLFIAQNTIDTRRIADELPAAVAQKEQLLQRHPALRGRFVFGYLGSLVKRKHVPSIVAAFNEVRARGVDASLVIAGSGPAAADVKAAVQASPYSADILLAGRIPVGEEGGWFQLFEVYLSFAEGGLGILESMAHGKTVVSTPEKYPETELLADNQTALLSGGFSVAAFADRMAQAVAERQHLAAIGERARMQVLARATHENMVAAIDQAVMTALKRRNPKKFGNLL
jgi:glycosyltransferase involved in cell wall biosynthesis